MNKEPLSIPSVLRLIVDAADQWNLGGAYVYAAALAYYTIFSIVPLLVLLVRIAIPFESAAVVEAQIFALIENAAGAVPAAFIEGIFTETDPTAGSGLATGLGIFFLIFGASTIFHQLQYSINAMYQLPLRRPSIRHGILYFLLSRLLSAVIVIGIGLFFLGLLIINVILIWLPPTPIEAFLQDFQATGFITTWLLTPAAYIFLFASVYKFLSGGVVRWRDVLPGSVLTMLLFVVGNQILRFYLDRVFQASIYGASGTLILFLLWIYYVSLIALFGAKVVAIYAERFGKPIVPKRRFMVGTIKKIEAHDPAVAGAPVPKLDPKQAPPAQSDSKQTKASAP